jgi:hypothetical protein
MDKARQEEIIKALESKNANKPCPRCPNLEFEILGEGKIDLYERAAIFGIPAHRVQVPVILLSCKSCGYIFQHATALLGLSR